MSDANYCRDILAIAIRRVLVAEGYSDERINYSRILAKVHDDATFYRKARTHPKVAFLFATLMR